MVRTYIPPVDNSRKPLGYGGSYNRSPAKVPPSTSPIPKERGNGRVFLAKKNAANSVIGEDSDSSTSSSDGPFNISLSRKNAVLVSKKWTAKAKSTKLRKKSVLASPKIVKRQTEKRDQKERGDDRRKQLADKSKSRHFKKILDDSSSSPSPSPSVNTFATAGTKVIETNSPKSKSSTVGEAILVDTRTPEFREFLDDAAFGVYMEEVKKFIESNQRRGLLRLTEAADKLKRTECIEDQLNPRSTYAHLSNLLTKLATKLLKATSPQKINVTVICPDLNVLHDKDANNHQLPLTQFVNSMITILHSESVGRIRFVIVRTGGSGAETISTLQLINSTIREVDNVELAVKDNNSISFNDLLRLQLVEHIPSQPALIIIRPESNRLGIGIGMDCIDEGAGNENDQISRFGNPRDGDSNDDAAIKIDLELSPTILIPSGDDLDCSLSPAVFSASLEGILCLEITQLVDASKIDIALIYGAPMEARVSSKRAPDLAHYQYSLSVMEYLCHLLRTNGKLMIVKATGTHRTSKQNASHHFLFCPDAYRPIAVMKQIAVGVQVLRSDEDLEPPTSTRTPRAQAQGPYSLYNDDSEEDFKFILEDIFNKVDVGIFNPQLA